MENTEIIRLFEAHSDDVFRLALSFLRNRQDAEDVCQSVFLKLMHYPQHRQRLQGPPEILLAQARGGIG